jgi:hypothetical protein
MKEGLKTTEFYVALAVITIGTFLLGWGETEIQEVVGAAMTILAALGYTASRAAVKRANMLRNQKVEQKITQVPVYTDTE